MSLPEMNDEPNRDEIIVEVRAIREALASQFDYDVDRLYEEVKRRERVSKRERVAPSPKRLSPATSA